MTAREALRTIRLLAGQGRVRFTFHAEEEAARLGAELAHVVFAVFALAHASRCSWQNEHETWKVKGADPFGVPLVVAVDLQDDCIVVTVFD